jgi:hypothetical protein
MYDDTTLKVMGIHERTSLAPDDVSAVASMDTAHMATATPFPESDLGPFPPGLDNERVLANSRAWCQARSSGALLFVFFCNCCGRSCELLPLLPLHFIAEVGKQSLADCTP